VTGEGAVDDSLTKAGGAEDGGAGVGDAGDGGAGDGQSDPSTTEEPAARTTARRGRRVSVRRRPWLALGVGLLGVGAAVAVPLLAMAASHTLSDSTVGEIVVPAPLQRLPDTPAVLVAGIDESGQVATLAVFAGSPTGAGGTIIVVPAGSGVEVPGRTTKARLGSLYAPGEEGLTALTGGVEDLLGITLNGSVALDEAGLAALLEPYGPFDVDLPGAQSDSVAGAPEVVVEAGATQLSAAEAARVLTALPTAESEVLRLPNVAATWQGIARAVGDGISAEGPDAAADDALTEVREVFSGSVGVRAVSAAPVLDLALNPDEVDLLEVDGVEILELVSRVLPGAASPVSSGLRIKLVDATGRPGAIDDAVLLMTYFGVAVVWIEDAPEQATTEVRYGNPDDVGVIRELESVFGPSQLAPAERPIEGIDATITLGRTFPEFPAEGGPITVETTVPASPVTFTLEPDATDDEDGTGGDDE
jgi:hypothetical protein